jgi:hypothetical protein
MSPEQEHRLEREIDQELQSLPELQAPETLLLRVRAALEQRVRVPWYRQSWQSWPAPLRVTAMIWLVLFFGALCGGAWWAPQTTLFAGLRAQFSSWSAYGSALWGALNTLLAALGLVFKQMGTGWMLGCVAAVALAWALCLGLGTACARLAFARR